MSLDASRLLGPPPAALPPFPGSGAWPGWKDFCTQTRLELGEHLSSSWDLALALLPLPRPWLTGQMKCQEGQEPCTRNQTLGAIQWHRVSPASSLDLSFCM